MDILETAHKELKASPRKPNVETNEISSNPEIFDV